MFCCLLEWGMYVQSPTVIWRKWFPEAYNQFIKKCSLQIFHGSHTKQRWQGCCWQFQSECVAQDINICCYQPWGIIYRHILSRWGKLFSENITDFTISVGNFMMFQFCITTWYCDKPRYEAPVTLYDWNTEQHSCLGVEKFLFYESEIEAKSGWLHPGGNFELEKIVIHTFMVSHCPSQVYGIRLVSTDLNLY